MHRRLAAANPAAYEPELAGRSTTCPTGWRDAGRPRRGPGRHRGGGGGAAAGWRRPTPRLRARPGEVAQQPVEPAGRGRLARRGPGRHRGGGGERTAGWPRPTPRPTSPPWRCRSTTCPSGWARRAGATRAWPRSRRRWRSTAGWRRPTPRPTSPTWRRRSTTCRSVWPRWAGGDEGLAAIEEAVGVYRRLAAANPAAYEPDLATSLNNLSVRLGEAGRRDGAWPPSRRRWRCAAGWRRPTPPPTSPTWRRRSTTCRSAWARRGARRGLAAIEEAVAVHRRLAAANPAAYEPDLGMSLNNLSVRLGEVGRAARPGRQRGGGGGAPPAGGGQPRGLRARPGDVAQQPVGPPGRGGTARRGPGRHRGGGTGTADWRRPTPRPTCPTSPCRSATSPISYSALGRSDRGLRRRGRRPNGSPAALLRSP